MNRFDPLKHKRGAGGKFADMLRNLKPGSAVELPDGIHVKASQSRVGGKQRRGYTVHNPGGKQAPGFHLEAQTAAVAALNHSARHEHPDAVGGKKKFTSYEAAIGGEPPLKGARPVAASLPHGEGGGQGHAKNLDDVRKSFDPDPMKARQQINNSKLPQFQKRELLIKVQREIAAKKDATGRIAPAPPVGKPTYDVQKMHAVAGEKDDLKALADAGYTRRDLMRYLDDTQAITGEEARGIVQRALGKGGAGAQGQNRQGQHLHVKGPGEYKPKAGDLKQGETKLNHSVHGDMVYMGRNATNHHVAAKADDLGGKKHIIRLKEISLGHAGKSVEEGAPLSAHQKEMANRREGRPAWGKHTESADANIVKKYKAEQAASVKHLLGDQGDGVSVQKVRGLYRVSKGTKYVDVTAKMLPRIVKEWKAKPGPKGEAPRKERQSRSKLGAGAKSKRDTSGREIPRGGIKALDAELHNVFPREGNVDTPEVRAKLMELSADSLERLNTRLRNLLGGYQRHDMKINRQDKADINRPGYQTQRLTKMQGLISGALGAKYHGHEFAGKKAGGGPKA